MSVLAAYIVPHPPLIIPEVGAGQEEGIQKTVLSYQKCAEQIAVLKPDTIIVISPHTTIYGDYFHISPGSSAHGDMSSFRAPGIQMDISYDTDMVAAISDEAFGSNIPAGTMGERDKSLDHATFIPLYFINKVYQDYKVVRIGFSGISPLEHYSFGKCIAHAADKLSKKIIIIASGDLSHKLKKTGPYGFSPEGPEFDKQIVTAIKTGNLLDFLTMPSSLAENAGECGLRSFQIMAGVLDGMRYDSDLMSYEGPFGVGYGVGAFTVTASDGGRHLDEEYAAIEDSRLSKLKDEESEIVRLARYSLETYVKTGKRGDMPANLSEELTGKTAGTFVSLKKHGQLRGCIGTISATKESIASEVFHNAISAGTGDPRFSPVKKDELKDLVYSVDVLGVAEKIESENELDPSRYGVIVTSGMKRGLLLPNLDGIDSAEQQIEIAKQKAGINPSEPVSLERFEVVRYK